MDTTQQTTALETLKPQTMVRIEQHVAHLLPQEEMRSRFAAVMMQQIRVSPALQKCSPESVIAAVVRMAQLQLDPALPNECWLVPFKSEATFIIGYGGLRKLALRSPEVRDILVAAVHEQDLYTSPNSPTALPIHQRAGKFRPRGKVIGYYAAALLAAGHWRVIEMSREEVKAHRDRYSRSAQSTFWNEGKPDEEGLSNFDKMALKTVLRQLCSPRNLTLSTEIKTALVHEEALYDAQYRQVEEPQQRVQVQSGNGHQAANDLFGGDQGLLGVGQHTSDMADDEIMSSESSESSNARTEDTVPGDDIPEKQHGGKLYLDQIDAAWRAGGLSDAQIGSYWVKTCKRFKVDSRHQLKGSLLPELLTEVRLWLQRQVPQELKPEPEPEPEELEEIGLDVPQPVNTMGSAWRMALTEACKGVQDKATLDAVWDVGMDPHTPDAVGLALLAQVQRVAEAGMVSGSV